MKRIYLAPILLAVVMVGACRTETVNKRTKDKKNHSQKEEETSTDTGDQGNHEKPQPKNNNASNPPVSQTQGDTAQKPAVAKPKSDHCEIVNDQFRITLDRPYPDAIEVKIINNQDDHYSEMIAYFDSTEGAESVYLGSEGYESVKLSVSELLAVLKFDAAGVDGVEVRSDCNMSL